MMLREALKKKELIAAAIRVGRGKLKFKIKI
jgi:hypothetical protein